MDFDLSILGLDEESSSGDENDKAMCRLCGEHEPKKFMIDIFGEQGLKYCLDIKIRKCLPIIVSREDGFPKSICMSCLNKLDITVELFESALRTYHSFLNLVKHNPAEAAKKGKRISKSKRRRQRKGSSNSSNVSEDTEYDPNEAGPSHVSEIDIMDETITIKEEPMDYDEEADVEPTVPESFECGIITDVRTIDSLPFDSEQDDETTIIYLRPDTGADEIEENQDADTEGNGSEGIEAIKVSEAKANEIKTSKNVKTGATSSGVKKGNTAHRSAKKSKTKKKNFK